jgi:hypothetical protein
MLSSTITGWLAALAFAASSPTLAQVPAERPNVVFILADNVGYGAMALPRIAANPSCQICCNAPGS